MSRVKSKKDINEEMKDYSLLQIKIGSINDRNTVVVNLEPFGDEEKAADTMVGWIQYGCISTLMKLIGDMLNDDPEKKLLILQDRLKQMKQLVEDIGEEIHDNEDNKKEEREKDITDIAKFFKSLLS